MLFHYSSPRVYVVVPPFLSLDQRCCTTILNSHMTRYVVPRLKALYHVPVTRLSMSYHFPITGLLYRDVNPPSFIHNCFLLQDWGCYHHAFHKTREDKVFRLGVSRKKRYFTTVLPTKLGQLQYNTNYASGRI